jgi:hypothetical protein
VRDSYQRVRPKKGSDFTHPPQVQDIADIIEQLTGISRPRRHNLEAEVSSHVVDSDWDAP